MNDARQALLGLIGLARKAGKLELGEEPVFSAASAHKARLILVAGDASENTLEKARRVAERGNCPLLQVELSKAELGGGTGRATCALLAFTDVGLAAAAAKKLAAGELARGDGEHFAAVLDRLDYKAAKTDRRRKEQRAKEKARQAQARKPWAKGQ